MRVKGHISPDKIEEIKNRTDIADLVSEHVTLKKAGRNLVGLCPFHKEKTPSFTVNRDKQIFYCFGCGEGGNVVTFLMRINDLSFPEAVRHLAKKAGIVIPQRIASREEKERYSLQGEIKNVNSVAANFYSRNLFAPGGKIARLHLQSRDIGEKTLREFHLGFAPDGWRNLKDFFEKENISLKCAEQAGLIIPKGNGGGSYYDRFRERLIFPIEDISGNVIAFGGRALGSGEPKYLNTPESPVYSKGKTLYGLNRTKDDIRKYGSVIIVEGYFDLLSLWNVGIRNVVATLGTALTKDHVDLIRRYTGNAVAVFDPDEAGKKALVRSMGLFLSGNIHAKAAILPEGDDPDQYVRKYGKEKFMRIIDHAQSMVDYYIENVIGKVGTLEEKRDALREAVSFIVHIENANERDLFIKRISERLGLNQELLIKEVNRALKVSVGKSADVPGERDMQIDMVELSIIHIMLEYPHKIPEIINENILELFMSANLRSLAEKLIESFETEAELSFDTSLFMQTVDNEIIRRKLLEKMIDGSLYDEEIVDRVVKDALKQMRRKWYKEKQNILTAKMRKAEESGDHELCNVLAREKEKLKR
ncbi:MAG: DNA primase [Deltaproteobacteria bacterium]|nr:DNA primase [Deltaproteobacteria bacterium]